MDPDRGLTLGSPRIGASPPLCQLLSKTPSDLTLRWAPLLSLFLFREEVSLTQSQTPNPTPGGSSSSPLYTSSICFLTKQPGLRRDREAFGNQSQILMTSTITLSDGSMNCFLLHSLPPHTPREFPRIGSGFKLRLRNIWPHLKPYGLPC